MSKSKTQLSSKEKRDRDRLEQIVSQSIQEAQRELAEIERIGLWRSSHETFEEYCFQRFGFNPLQLDAESLIQLVDRASPDNASELRRMEDEP